MVDKPIMTKEVQGAGDKYPGTYGSGGGSQMTLREQIAQILVKNNLRTDQVAIGQLVDLIKMPEGSKTIDRETTLREALNKISYRRDLWEKASREHPETQYFNCHRVDAANSILDDIEALV